MLNRLLISALCVLLTASWCLAEKKQIKLKNGETVVGEVVEQTPEGVKVKGKIATVFYPKDQIVSIEGVQDVKQDYADRLAKLKADDFDSQLDLGRWAMDNKLYPQAVTHLEAAVKLKNDERARLLLRQAKAKLDEVNKPAGADTPPATKGETADRAGETKVEPTSMLTDDDVNRIRMAELGEKDRVTVELRKNVVDRFLEQVRGQQGFDQKTDIAEFRRMPQSWQAWKIIEKTGLDDPLRQDIIIKSDPAAMREFRGTIWREVAANCATASCHGSAKGKHGLKMWNILGRNDNVDYTNFLIMDSFHVKGGELINRAAPEESLLLQFGLPENVAHHRHPKEIKPMFAGKNAADFQAAKKWIELLKGPQHPDYGIKTLPPFVMTRVNPMSGLFGSGPGKDDKSKDKKDADKKDADKDQGKQP
jgi:hypothetical protein